MAEKSVKIRKPLMEMPLVKSMIVSVTTVLLGLVVGSILIIAIGKNPIEGYQKIIFGALSNTRRLGNTIAYATQLILVGLSVSFAFKTGLFNIGGAGQMLMGGLMASIWAHNVTFLPQPIYYLSLVLVAGISGAIWGLIPGLLKAKFNVHEVVGTIMFNWIAYWFVYDAVKMFIVDPTIIVKSKPLTIEQSLRTQWLSDITQYSYFNLGFFLAIFAVIVIWYILEKTTLGFDLKVVGANRYCAEYAGIKVNRSIVISMGIAGCLAGLAGLTYFLGFSNIIEIGKSPSEGFDGIAVALLGNSNPLGVFVSALFFGVLKMGKGSLTAIGIPTEIADTIISIIIYFTATSTIIYGFWNKVLKKSAKKKQNKLVKEEK